MSTATVIAGLVTVAAIHWAQVVPTIRDTPLLGTAFLIFTITCVVIAGALLVSDRNAVWWSAAAVNALSVAAYIFTRTVSTALDNQDVGNWSENLGMVALLVETLLVGLSAYGLLQGRDRRTPHPIEPDRLDAIRIPTFDTTKGTK